uniref:Nucleoredoxin n=1 Tax=Leptobrachium leishanense TaxID=445787 RepID=A0A8C5QRN0_9ANUR
MLHCCLLFLGARPANTSSRVTCFPLSTHRALTGATTPQDPVCFPPIPPCSPRSNYPTFIPGHKDCFPHHPRPTTSQPVAHRSSCTCISALPQPACKLKLWNKYRISNIPSLIFIEASTGKIVCRNGLLLIKDDPEGLEFPWGPKPFCEVIAGPLIRSNGQSQESSTLDGSYVGVYFSAHWCPPCRSLTRVLVETYRKIKESGQKFEIVLVSADRSEESFKQYFSEMPWLAVPYSDEARRSRLNRLYGIQGIPNLIILDPNGEVLTRQGRVEVLHDVDCKEFPWHPKPVVELTDLNAVQLNEGPCLVLFVDSEDDGESEAAKQLIQPIAEKIIAQYKAKDEEAPLLFFVAGEDDMTDYLRDFTNLPEAAPLLTILDMSARAKYVMDVEEITPEIVDSFVSDFLAEKLKPEPI